MAGGPYAFIYLKGVKKIANPLVRHVHAQQRADPTRQVPEDEPKVVHLAGDEEAASEAIAHERISRKSKRGARPHEGLMILCSGPPRYDTDEEGVRKPWTLEQEIEWAWRSYAFILTLIGPKSVVVSADLHRDEAAPHLHVLVVPRDSKGVLAWKRRKAEALGPVLGINAKAQRGKRVFGDEYSALQTAYWRAVGPEFGLERGVIRKKAPKHAPPDRAKAEQYIMETAQRKADQALEAARREGEEIVADRKSVV